MLVGIVRLIFWTSKGGMGRWKLTEKEGWIRIEVRVVVCVNRFVKMKEHLPFSSSANISMSDQRCFNFVDQHWNNADPMLKMKQNLTSGFQCCTTLIKQHWNNVAQRWNIIEHWNNVAQRWYNVVSILFKGGLNIVEITLKPLRLLNMDL